MLVSPGVLLRPGQLEEAHVGLVGQHGRAAGGDVDPPLVEGVPLAGAVVPHLDPQAAHHVVVDQVGALHALGVVGGLEALGPGHLGPGGVDPVDPRHREAGGPQAGRRTAGPVAVQLRRQRAGQGPQVLLELEARRVGVEVEHDEAVGVAEGEGAARPGGARHGLEALAVGLAPRAGRGLAHRVDPVGRRQLGCDPAGLGQQGPVARVVDGDVDHQAEAPEQHRGAAERRRPVVEVGHRRIGPRGAGPRDRLGLVLGLLSLVVAPGRVGVDQGPHRRVGGSHAARHLVVEEGRQPLVVTGVLGVEQDLDRGGPRLGLRGVALLPSTPRPEGGQRRRGLLPEERRAPLRLRRRVGAEEVADPGHQLAVGAPDPVQGRVVGQAGWGQG